MAGDGGGHGGLGLLIFGGKGGAEVEETELRAGWLRPEQTRVCFSLFAQKPTKNGFHFTRLLFFLKY